MWLDALALLKGNDIKGLLEGSSAMTHRTSQGPRRRAERPASVGISRTNLEEAEEAKLSLAKPLKKP